MNNLTSFKTFVEPYTHNFNALCARSTLTCDFVTPSGLITYFMMLLFVHCRDNTVTDTAYHCELHTEPQPVWVGFWGLARPSPELYRAGANVFDSMCHE